jgi:hypothetical protein
MSGEDGGVLGKRDVLPGAAGGAPLAADDLEPGGLAEIAVPGAVLDRPERAVGEVGTREVRDRVAPRLEEHDGVVALHHGATAELGAQAAPQRLGVQDALGHAGDEEAPAGIAAAALAATRAHHMLRSFGWTTAREK